MQLGILIEGHEGLSWERWRRLAARVEALGFDSLWRSDHVLSIIDEDREAHDAWLALTVAALETQRLQIGSLVSPITFRHPAMLAKLAASVDGLSQGRLVLGVGAGWNEREHRAHGLPFPSFRERLERLREGVEIIVRLQGDEPVNYQGRHYTVEAANPYPKPVRQKIPLLIGGRGRERFLELVARYADEWNMTTNSPSFYRERSALLEAQCHAVGRDPAAIRRSVAVGMLVGRNAREIERRSLAMQRLIPHLAGVSASEAPAAARASGWVCGKPDEVAQQLRDLAAAGVDRIMLQHNDFDDDDALELMAREVAPAIA